jgi:hypothetical protein
VAPASMATATMAIRVRNWRRRVIPRRTAG